MANSFELSGTLKVLEDPQTFASGFTKREFVIEVPDGNYPQMVKFECVREKIDQLDNFSIGDALKVTFDIRGNEYKGRYYVNLNAWKIQGEGSGSGDGSNPSSDAAPSDPPAGAFDSNFDNESEVTEDDIPF
jgi:single-strand DNA-binding protein